MFQEMQERSIFNTALENSFKYLDEVFDRNIFPTDEAINNLKYFDEEFPATSSDAHNLIGQLNKYGAPATMAQLGGRYFGFVNGSAVPAGLAAKTMGTFWDQNTAMQVISPIASKLESVVEKWLRQIFGFPENVVAGFVSGTSAANVCGLAAGRYRQLKNIGWDVNEDGLFDAPKLRIVTGRHAHSSVLKAISILGFGKNRIEWVDTDEQGRILPERLPHWTIGLF